MSLTSGSRLGPYEVIGSLGAGGMGEVYRARDTRLDRDVALKILPESFAADPERLARFEREAKTLAALNHPHIAQIYGVEETPSRSRALVMELVEGEDLSQRITRGAIPIDEALPIARQIAAALEAAHELGIIHRDLKPANVKLRPDGTVKVLDFGLAKALDRSDVSGVSPALANSPTITTPAMTQAGMILGTAAYMSPEQAKGRAVDRRTDLWAFGCVLFEMLTGQRAFAGDDVTDTLTAIFRDEPQWSALPADTPAPVQRLMRRCLQKDRARRLDSAAMARIELDEPAGLDSSPIAQRGQTPLWLLLSLGAATIASLIVAGIALTRPAALPDAPALRFSLTLPTTQAFRNVPGGAGLVLSPDGRNIVYTSGVQGALVRRRLDSEDFEVLKEPGSAPFFSPDSKWLAFFADGRLKKVPIDGGLTIPICDTEAGRGTWGDDGTIVLATAAGLFRVASDGGTPERVGSAGSTRLGGGQPIFLPGSSAVVIAKRIDGNERIQALTLADGLYHDLAPGGDPVYADDRQLVFEHDNQLWVAALDLKRLTLSGAPAPLLDGFRVQGQSAIVSVAANRTLAYMPAETIARSMLVWLDRKGQITPALPEPGGYSDPRLSPDGGRLAVSMFKPGGGADVWVVDLSRRGAKLRLTLAGINLRPRWTPDGARVTFAFDGDIYQRRADGTGDREPVLVRPDWQYPEAWATDGNSLIYSEGTAARDLWSLRIGAEPVRLHPPSSFNERGGSPSPNGKWLVFTSNESGRDEIYVQPFPGPGPKVAISTGGGLQPAWSRDGRELFYRQGDVMMVVPIGSDPRSAGTPQRLFDFPAVTYGLDRNKVEYDVAADGRLLAVRGGNQEGGQEIRVVTNWLADRPRAGDPARR